MILTTLICFAIALGIFAGAFYLSKYVVGLQHRVHVLEDSYKDATDHIADQEKTVVLLQQEIDFMRRETEIREHQSNRQRVWNPGDPLNIGNRHA